jgi:thiol-disulfide isomerase/thioredoxin
MTSNTQPLFTLLVRSCLCLALTYPVCAAQVMPSQGTGASKRKQSPASCAAEIDTLLDQSFRDAQEAGHDLDLKALRVGIERIANGCISSFSVASVRPQQLPPLTRLYLHARQARKAQESVDRYINSRASKASKAELLLLAINFSIYPGGIIEGLHKSTAGALQAAYAEAYLKKLELLGPAFAREQMTGNLQLAKHYLVDESGPSALKHQSRIIELGRRLKPEEHKRAFAQHVAELTQLAMMTCTVVGPEKARFIIEQISSELIRIAESGQEISTQLKRYSLAGRPVPKLLPKFTFNSQSGTEDIQATGQVTVILFAAPWCGPCKPLYPQLAAIHEKYGDEGLRVMLATHLEGFFGNRKGLKPDEEAAAIQDYYVVQNKLPFPILVEAAAETELERASEPSSGNDYLYTFYPQVLVIDKKGKTRAILLGTLPGQEDRLRAKVEQLLKEPS